MLEPLSPTYVDNVTRWNMLYPMARKKPNARYIGEIYKAENCKAVRDALEQVPLHDGLVKRYAPPFTPTRHEALGPAELLMARYRDDGVIVPATNRPNAVTAR